MLIESWKGPCLKCVLGPVSEKEESLQSQADPVFPTLPGLVASIQSSVALKRLLAAEVCSDLLVIDLMQGKFMKIPIQKNSSCPVCGRGRV